MDEWMMDYWLKTHVCNPPIHSSINPFIRVNPCPSVVENSAARKKFKLRNRRRAA
jgi:hypothetical protein